MIGGYTLIQVFTREAAMEWARRFPPPFGREAEGIIEVRQLYEMGDFPPGDAADPFKTLLGDKP